jgi:hypothetical protein
MSVKIDKTLAGDWQNYKVNFVAVDNKKDGKQVEMSGYDEGVLGLYGLMPLADAKIIHQELGDKIRALEAE